MAPGASQELDPVMALPKRSSRNLLLSSSRVDRNDRESELLSSITPSSSQPKKPFWVANAKLNGVCVGSRERRVVGDKR
jgi:hypothetical protein